MCKSIFLSAVVFCIYFSSAHAQTKTITSNLTLTQNTTWNNLVIIDGARVNVNQDVTLTIEPGTIVSGKNGALLYIMGKLVAFGEKDKKIRFMAEENEKSNFSLSYYIDSASTSEINMKNFILEKGGGNQDTASLAALTIRGKATLSQGIIRRNLITGVKVWSSSVKIEDSEVYENENIAVENKSTNTLDAKNNWWGSEDGPTTTALPNSPRAVVKGGVDYGQWQKKGPVPIIIVPGFGGSFSFKLFSEKAADDWWLTTLGTSSYRYFVKALILSNYYHDKDFFWAFYDWRQSCEKSAKEYLAKAIAEAKKQSGHSQVHLVAHSMGGLVARSYIQGTDFQDDVDQLVTAGTPHLGSSEVYPIWEGARLTEEKKPYYLYLWYLQALDWDWNRVEFIRKNFASLGEMMPIYDYLKNPDDRTISYANQKQKNSFLEDLNNSENLEKLKRRVNISLFAGDGEETLEKIKVIPYESTNSKWEDGIPDPLDPPKDTIKGDGTVTVKSASGNMAISKQLITLGSPHSRLMETGTKPIFEQLKIRAKFPLLFKLMSTFLLTSKGPVDTIIKDGLGNVFNEENIGKDSVFQEEMVEGQKLSYAELPQELASGEEKKIEIYFKGKYSGHLKAAAWNISDSENYSKEELDNPVVKGMELNYSVNINKDSISVSPRISIKNLMVMVDRWYGEQKISNWAERRDIINRLAEAYQAQSNNRLEEALEKITTVQNSVSNSGLIQKIIVF